MLSKIIKSVQLPSDLKTVKYLFFAFLFLTVLMATCIQCFNIEDIFHHPQHPPGDDLKEFFEALQSPEDPGESYRFWYYSFFWVDIVWSLSLVTFLIKCVQYVLSIASPAKKSIYTNRTVAFTCTIGIIAWVLDLIEGGHYFTCHIGMLGIIVFVKKIAYAIFIVLSLLLFIYLTIRRNHLSQISIFLKSSALSLLLIIVFLYTLSLVDQGGIMIIDLFYTPWNIISLFVLVNFSALVLSHFPSYFAELIDKNEKTVWSKHPQNSSRLFGIIHFEKGPTSGLEARELGSFLRRSLGTTLLLVWIFVLFHAADDYILHLDKALYYSLYLTLVISVLYKQHDIYQLSQRLSETDLSKPTAKGDSMLRSMDSSILWFRWLIITSFILTVAFSALCIICPDWNAAYALILITIAIGNVFAFIYFRENRKYLMYFLGIEEKWSQRSSECPKMLGANSSIIECDVRKRVNQLKLKTTYSIFKYLGNCSNHIYFLRSMRIGFIIISAFILTIALCWTPLLSPIVYIVYFLTSLVYMSAFIVKHFIYYYQTSSDGTEDCKGFLGDVASQKKFKFWVPFFMVVLAGIAITGFNVGNTLHRFPLVPESKKATMSLNDFRNKVDSITIADGLHNRPLFSVASFGGGLKANYWTINVLDALEAASDNNFINKTISMSGASGGAMGLAAYPFIHGDNPADRRALIDKIGSVNILSIDASYLFFQDFVREMIPKCTFPNDGSDRSHRAMYEYYKVLKSEGNGTTDDFHDLSYRLQWKKFYDEHDYYPALIMNTTSTNRRYGYACSLRDVELSGGINIVDYDIDTSISYFDAASTVNRFAFVSPAAAVPQKGHFVDGGYFENSGLLSTLSFWRAFDKDTTRKDYCYTRDSTINRPLHVLCLVNGKGYWINHLLGKAGIAKNDLAYEKSSAEIGAILNTVSGTEMLPTYYIDYMQEELGERFHPIFMPLLFDYEDVVDVLGGKPDDDDMETIRKIIKRNKEDIKNALEKYADHYKEHWGIVQPSLSRILSEPDRQYQKAMINKHDSLRIKISQLATLSQTSGVSPNSVLGQCN